MSITLWGLYDYIKHTYLLLLLLLSRFSPVRLCATPQMAAHQAPLSVEFSMEWVAISFFRDLPNPVIKPMSLTSPALAGRSATWEAQFSSCPLSNFPILYTHTVSTCHPPNWVAYWVFLYCYFHFSLSCIGEGNGNPLRCSCLENPRDGGAWWAAVYGVAQSQTRLKRLSSSSSSTVHEYSLLKQKENIWYNNITWE